MTDALKQTIPFDVYEIQQHILRGAPQAEEILALFFAKAGKNAYCDVLRAWAELGGYHEIK
jgi:hypothetical protein